MAIGLDIWIYSILSVVIVSLISLIGVSLIPVKSKKFSLLIMFLLSFSVGALLGDAFIHLLPEAIEESGAILWTSVYALFGMVLFFGIEKIIHLHHTHAHGIYKGGKIHRHSDKRSIAIINLIGDGVHNLIDGIIIGVSFLVSIPVGIATTIAVILHEIPQEFGDFGVLIYGGFSKIKALMFNLLSALVAVIGVLIALLLGEVVEGFSLILLPVAAGGFIYIAASNIIPELQKEIEISKTMMELAGILLGVGVMYGLLLVAG